METKQCQETNAIRSAMPKVTMMSKPRIVQLKGFDGSIISIEVTKDYSIKKWHQQKCWAFFCNNLFYFIHLNRNGKATHAYCYHASDKFSSLGERGKWVHIEKGKLVVDWEAK